MSGPTPEQDSTRDRRAAQAAPLSGVSNLRNVLASWGSFVLSASAGLFLSPFVVGSLGATSYGVWVLVGSLTGSLSLLDLGIKSAVTRFIARERALGAHEDASRLASTARIMYAAAAALALGVTAVLAVGLTAWFTIPPELTGASRLVLILAGTSLAIVLATGLYGGILAGVERLDVIGFSNIGMEALRIVLVLGVLYLGGGLVGLGLIVLLITMMRYAYQRRAAERLYPELELQASRPLKADVRAILDISVFSTVIYSMATISAQVNIYVLGATLPPTMVTFYAIGGTLPIYAQSLSLPVAQVVLPQASRLSAAGDVSGLRTLILDSGRYGTLAVLPMVLVFLTRGPTFIGIWMGSVYRDASGAVLVILSLSTMFQLARHVMQTAFVGSGKHRRLAPWYIAEALAVAVLSVLMIRRWGLPGAAWAAVTPNLVLATIVFPVLVAREFGMSAMRIWFELWIRPFTAMLPFAAATLIVDRSWPSTSYLGFFAQVGLLLPLAAAGALAIGLSGKERGRLLTTVVERTRAAGRFLTRS